MDIVNQEAMRSRPDEYWLKQAGCLDRLQGSPDFIELMEGYLADRQDICIELLADAEEDERKEITEILLSISYMNGHLRDVVEVAERIEQDIAEGVDNE